MHAPTSDSAAQAEDAPRISVVIPHYDNPAGLDACLAALGRQTIAERFEIVVADNMSPQGEDAVAAVIAGRARLVIARERGAGPARNAGVMAARGAILAFTDADCVPAPGWLAAGVAALGACDFAGGRMEVFVEGRGRKSGAAAFEQVYAFDNEDYVRRKGFTVTANLFCRRDVFASVGGFRVGVPEDLEWCHRATAAGYRLGYAADALVAHPARPDWPSLRGKWRRLAEEAHGLVPRTPAAQARWLARAWVLAPSILAHAPRVLRSPALHGPRERLAALATLARLRLWRMGYAHRLTFGGKR